MRKIDYFSPDFAEKITFGGRDYDAIIQGSTDTRRRVFSQIVTDTMTCEARIWADDFSTLPEQDGVITRKSTGQEFRILETRTNVPFIMLALGGKYDRRA